MKAIAEVLTFENFQAWVRAQPPDEEFNYVDNQSCAVAKFLTAQGFVKVSVGPTFVDWPERVAIPKVICMAMNHHLRSPMWPMPGSGWYKYKDLTEALEKASAE